MNVKRHTRKVGRKRIKVKAHKRKTNRSKAKATWEDNYYKDLAADLKAGQDRAVRRAEEREVFEKAKRSKISKRDMERELRIKGTRRFYLDELDDILATRKKGAKAKRSRAKPPEGFVHVDWEGLKGKTWKDTIPEGALDMLSQSPHVKIKKVIRNKASKTKRKAWDGDTSLHSPYYFYRVVQGMSHAEAEKMSSKKTPGSRY